MRVKPVRGLAWQAIDGEAVILDLTKGRSIGLNSTGALVWELLPNLDDNAIADELVSRFGIEPQRAREDVERLIRALLDRGLVEEVEEETK